MGTAERQEVKSFSDLIAEVSEKSGVKRADTQAVLMALRDAIVATVAGEKKIFRLRDIGNLRLLPTEERTVRNPQTGEQFTAPAGYRLKFSKGSAWNDSLAAETVEEEKPKKAAAKAPDKPKPTPEKAKAAPAPAKKAAPAKSAKPAPKAATKEETDELSELLEGE